MHTCSHIRRQSKRGPWEAINMWTLRQRTMMVSSLGFITYSSLGDTGFYSWMLSWEKSNKMDCIFARFKFTIRIEIALQLAYLSDKSMASLCLLRSFPVLSYVWLICLAWKGQMIIGCCLKWECQWHIGGYRMQYLVPESSFNGTYFPCDRSSWSTFSKEVY